MSNRKMWKMLHLLYNINTNGLTEPKLKNAGVDCNPDTIYPLLDSKAVVFEDGEYRLTQAAREILRCCIVANRKWGTEDIQVDSPEVFVVMPFSELWSDNVYNWMIKPAIKDAGFKCIRGDTPIRATDLENTIWNALLKAGLIVADISGGNPNVFYEIGLAHALGKDVFILKQKEAKVPADFGGTHYYAYELDRLDYYQKTLRNAIKDWGEYYHVDGVRAIQTSISA
jgi:hypothetical protein